MSKMKDNDWYINKLKEKSITSYNIEEYRGYKVEIKHVCGYCHNEYLVKPVNVLKGHMCPKCRKDRLKPYPVKTNEKYLEDLKSKNFGTIPLENYLGQETPIHHRCSQCNTNFILSPRQVLRTGVCPECSKVNWLKNITFSHEQYLKQLSDLDIQSYPIEKYVNSATPINHICGGCGKIVKQSPSNVLNGEMCRECGNKKLSKVLMFTTEQYLIQLKDANIGVSPLEEYKGNNKKIRHKCNCGNIWESTPTSVLIGSECPECAIKKFKDKVAGTHEDYLKKLKVLEIDVKPLEKYVNISTNIQHVCSCGRLWSTSPERVLSGRKCRKCTSIVNGFRKRHSHEDYLAMLSSSEIDVIPLANYNGYNTKIQHKCVCGNTWEVSPSRVLNGGHCGVCTQSRGEYLVEKFLKLNKIIYNRQQRFDGCRDSNALPFDFYLIDYNCAIEVQGIQHYQVVEWFGGIDAYLKLKFHDEIKKEYCLNSEIRFLEIKYTELENINAIIETFITSKEVNRYVN